jgi:hypothetical protein
MLPMQMTKIPRPLRCSTFNVSVIDGATREA